MVKIGSIYIVDDDIITVFGIKKILSKSVECNTILDFENGKQAIDSILLGFKERKDIPDVIFLDLNMPIMDGWQFLEEFLKLPLQKKVLINIITSSIDPADKSTWENYKGKTAHQLNFKIKPIFSLDFKELVPPSAVR